MWLKPNFLFKYVVNILYKYTINILTQVKNEVPVDFCNIYSCIMKLFPFLKVVLTVGAQSKSDTNIDYWHESSWDPVEIT